MSKKSRRSSLQIEALEDRTLMAAALTATFSDGVLKISGTSKDDAIYVAQDKGRIEVRTIVATSGPSSTTTTPGGIIIETYETTYEKKAIDISKGSGTVKSLKAGDVKEIKVYGVGGNDRIRLDDGSQTIIAKSYLSGGDGKDFIVGGGGKDEIRGGDDDDTLYGMGGDDKLYGEGDDDKLYGNGGDDKLYGGDGEDRLNGHEGRDSLYGGSNADNLFGILGEDLTLDGGTGDDHSGVNFHLDTFFEHRGHGSIVEPRRNDGTDTYDVWMDLGGKGRSIINEFVGQTRQFTSQLQPIVNLLNQRLDVAEGLSTPTLGELLGGNTKAITDTSNDLNQYDSRNVRTGYFHLGEFTRSHGRDVRQTAKGDLASQGFVKELKKLDGGAFNVSGLTDATNLVKLALGREIDLLRFDAGKLALSSGKLEQHLGTVPVFGIPVSFYLRGSLNFEAGGSIAYDTKGIREGNLLRGLKLANAYATFSAPVALEAETGVPGYKIGGGGSVTGSYTVSVGNVRLGDGDSLRSKMSASGGLYFRMYLYAEYMELIKVPEYGQVKDWKNAFEWVWQTVITGYKDALTPRRDEVTIYDNFLPM